MPLALGKATPKRFAIINPYSCAHLQLDYFYALRLFQINIPPQRHEALFNYPLLTLTNDDLMLNSLTSYRLNNYCGTSTPHKARLLCPITGMRFISASDNPTSNY